MSLSKKLAKKGFQQGSQIENLRSKAAQISPDYAGAGAYEARKALKTDPNADIEKSFNSGLNLYRQKLLREAQQKSRDFWQEARNNEDSASNTPDSLPRLSLLPGASLPPEETPSRFTEGVGQLAASIGILGKELLSDPTTYLGAGPGKLGALLAGLSYSPETEASPDVKKLLQMVYRGHNGQLPELPSALYATPQKSIAEYYAQKRVNQAGGIPTVDSLLIDPSQIMSRYGHSIPLDDINREIRTTRALRLTPDDVVEKYAAGGLARIAKHLTKEPARKGVSEVMKEKGGNWLAGGTEKLTDRLKESLGEIDPQRIQRIREVTQNPTLGVIGETLAPWVDKQLTRYIKNEMATPDDPVRALAERGILHVPPDALNVNLESYLAYPLSGTYPIHGKTPLAQSWEGASDLTLNNAPAGAYSGPTTIERNPWLKKLDPETPVYTLNRMSGSDLGFDHLIDELSNAIDPGSGLPHQLQLNPASLQRMGMANAVEHVHKINEWRAAQKAEANAALANNAATRIHKEYPENNPLGLKWVELRASGPHDTQLASTPEEFNNVGKVRKDLENALKYEGDTMGHCVGGYCDDVLSGRSQIYSLRDAKGQPHVTIEVSPPTPQGDSLEKAANQFRGLEEFVNQDMVNQKALAREAHPTIVQIKGKQNRAPNPEYLPFVQDFVKSGNWADVGDLKNTGLIRKSALTPEEQALVDSDYLTLDEVKKLREGKSWTPLDNDPEFAEGGSVQSNNSSLNDDLMQHLLQIAAEKYQQFNPGL